MAKASSSTGANGKVKVEKKAIETAEQKAQAALLKQQQKERLNELRADVKKAEKVNTWVYKDFEKMERELGSAVANEFFKEKLIKYSGDVTAKRQALEEFKSSLIK